MFNISTDSRRMRVEASCCSHHGESSATANCSLAPMNDRNPSFQAFRTPSFGDENFNLDDSLKPAHVIRNSNSEPSDQSPTSGSSPVAIRCTTQVAVLQPYPIDPYQNTTAYEAGPHPFIRAGQAPSSQDLSPGQLPLHGQSYSDSLTARSLGNLDSDQSGGGQYSHSYSRDLIRPAYGTTHYSPQPGAVPPYNPYSNPHLRTDQYYQPSPQTQQGCPQPPVIGYGSSLSNYLSYNGDPQFPPQNFIDIPDITENNSVYYHYNQQSAGYRPRTSYIPMAQRDPILSTMDEAVGRQAPGTVMTSPVNNSDDSDDNLPLTKITRGKVTKRKRGGRGGGRGGIDTSPGKVAEGKKTRTPKKRRKKDPNEPVKPVSAYAMFFRDTQAAIKSQNPKATFGDVSKIVASMWDGLDEEAKSEYKVKTEIAKKEYLQKLAAYRASLVSQGADGVGGSNDIASPQVSPERNFPSTSVGENTAAVDPPAFQNQEEYSKPRDSMQSVFVPTAANSLGNEKALDNDHESAGEQFMQTTNGVEAMQDMEQDAQSELQQAGESAMETTHTQDTKGDPTEGSSNGSSHTEDSIAVNTNVFYGKSQPQPLSPSVSPGSNCTRVGCEKDAVDSPMWDSEYCSNQCVVEHCRDVFTAWVASRSGFASVN